MDWEADTEEEFILKLDTFPAEILLHICSFLSADFVINVLSKVCRKFKDIIEDDITWKMRIFRRWPKQYPLIPDTISSWKEACIERECHYDLWKNSGENMKLHDIKDAHFGSVNVVQVLENGNLCASGGRDGVLKIWNISSLKENFDSENTATHLLHTITSAHNNAWVWSMAYDEQHRILYSSGFDTSIKSWDISDPSISINSYCLQSPTLCLAAEDQAFVAGCYGRSVNLFDPRIHFRPVMQHVHHKKSVICVAYDGRFVISGSEDHTVLCYDKVAKKVLATLKFEEFPLCMSYNSYQLLVGDVKGFVHVVDHTKGMFEQLQSFQTGHNTKVTGILHSMGSIITSSTDKTIRILEPNADPSPITVLNTASEVSKISAYKKTLASANTDDSISIWLPAQECS